MNNNTYIIQTKDSNLIRKSSSGGMFAELAKYVLSQNGVVFGCAIERVEDGFDVKHIYIEKEDELYKLQGSKYVQSNLGCTIKQAKEFLENGRLVLFSGTPCQIAGLKVSLKQNYDNLLTVDLSCTGTPPQKMFNDFIRHLEKKYKQEIIKFDFRNKEKLGWSCGNALITFKSGKQKILHNNIVSYLYFFMNGISEQERCYKCRYAGLERISDITIADAWGVEIVYPELLKNKYDQNKGISLVLINSNNGEKIFNNIKENIILTEIDINKLKRYNHPLRHPSIKSEQREKYMEEYEKNGYAGLEKLFRKNLGGKYYYYILKNHTPKFIKNIIKLLIHKNTVDCLLVTAYLWPNYGSLLTAYALQKTINDLGYTTKLIKYADNYGYTKGFTKKYLKTTKMCVNLKDFKQLNKITNTFVLGSDNLINLKINKFEFVAKCLMNFTNLDKKRIMISGSTGQWDGTTKNVDDHNYIKGLLERFDYISTREIQGKNVIENNFACKAEWINDPVFYLEKEEYVKLVQNTNQNYSNKIMKYILYPNTETEKIVEKYKNKFDCKVVSFFGNENVKYLNFNKDNSVENWLSAIINSKLVITDSFHCVCFSLMFNKPFICIKNTHATERFLSLFERLGLNIKLVEKLEDLDNYDFNYDFKKVEKEIFNIRDFAINKIQDKLLATKFITNEDIQKENEFQKMNKKYLVNFDNWYKKNKIFYQLIIKPFVIPFLRIRQDIKCKK